MADSVALLACGDFSPGRAFARPAGPACPQFPFWRSAGDLIRTVKSSRQPARQFEARARGFALVGSIGLVLVGVGCRGFAESLLLEPQHPMARRAVPVPRYLPLVIVWFGIGESGDLPDRVWYSRALYLNTVLGSVRSRPCCGNDRHRRGCTGREHPMGWLLPCALRVILAGLRLSLPPRGLALVIVRNHGRDPGSAMATNAVSSCKTT